MRGPINKQMMNDSEPRSEGEGGGGRGRGEEDKGCVRLLSIDADCELYYHIPKD